MLCITVAGAPDNDYQAVSGDIVQFNVGDTYQTHTIIINDDDECENNPNVFFSNLALNDGVQPINVINPRATVTIDDSEESECSEYFVHKSFLMMETYFVTVALFGCAFEGILRFVNTFCRGSCAHLT